MGRRICTLIMNILSSVRKEFDRMRYYQIALAWLLLMVFFTYTTILSESMVAGSSFECVHWTNQYSLIAMMVNCGLLFMVVFDYMLIGKSMSFTMIWVIFLGIIIAICIYGHTSIMATNTASEYKSPLDWPSLSICLHLVFLIILLWLKERAVELDMSEIEIVEEYRQ